MVFARWQCLGLGGILWRTQTPGKLFDPGEDEWLSYFHPDDQGPIALGLADPAVNTFPDVRILSANDGIYKRAAMRMFFPPFETDGHIFALVFSVKESSANSLAEVTAYNQTEHMLSSSTAEVVELSRATGVVKNCSLSFEGLNHLAENEASGKSWLSLGLMEPAYGKLFLEKISHHAELKNYPAVLQSRKGQAREVLMDVLPSLDDEENVVLTFKDVTTHNYACRHLHEILDHLPFGVFTRGIEDGLYQLSNTRANELLNGGAPLRGLGDQDLFEAGELARVSFAAGADPKTGRLDSITPVYLANGRREIQYFPMCDPTGKVNRLLGLVRDLSSAEFQESNCLKMSHSDVLTVGHELRTPLNAILGFTALLSETVLESAQQEMLQSVRASGEGLMKTVDGMLALAELSDGEQLIVAGALNLEALLEDLGEAYHRKALGRGLRLSVEVDPRIPAQVDTDESKLRQLMSHLVENAIKFTPEGEVSLQADLIECADNRATIVISVSDTGIGIPQSKQKLIFEAFQQADSSENRSFEGCGLGLSVSDRLARVMGTRIEVHSVVGEGSVFSIKLDLKVSAPGLLGDIAPCPKDLNILLFALEKGAGSMLSRMLSIWGAHVQVATTFDEFYRELQNPATQALGLCVWAPSGAGLSDSEGLKMVEEAKAGRLIILTGNELDTSILVDECGSHGVVPSLIRGSFIRRSMIAFMEASERNAAETDSYAQSVEQPFRGRRALILDDRSDERRTLLGWLSAWGLKTDVCESERAAIDLFGVNTYDIVFFEANFLGKDTAAMLRGLQLHLDHVESTTFVGMSHAHRDIKALNLAAIDVNHFLPKPIHRATLRALLDGLF